MKHRGLRESMFRHKWLWADDGIVFEGPFLLLQSAALLPTCPIPAIQKHVQLPKHMVLLCATSKHLHCLHLYLGISSNTSLNAINLVHLQNSAQVSFLQGGISWPHLLHRMDPSSLELPLCLKQMIIIERITIYCNYLSSGLIPPPDWASWETGFSFFPDSIVINTGLSTW